MVRRRPNRFPGALVPCAGALPNCFPDQRTTHLFSWCAGALRMHGAPAHHTPLFSWCAGAPPNGFRSALVRGCMVRRRTAQLSMVCWCAGAALWMCGAPAHHSLSLVHRMHGGASMLLPSAPAHCRGVLRIPKTKEVEQCQLHCHMLETMMRRRDWGGHLFFALQGVLLWSFAECQRRE